MRGDAEIAEYGRRLGYVVDALKDTTRQYNDLREAREILMRVDAFLCGLLAKGDEYHLLDPVMRDRISDAWRHVHRAMDEADVAVVTLGTSLGEPPRTGEPEYVAPVASSVGGGVVA
jgi:hypothetical protein